jgi:hypothetical protein
LDGLQWNFAALSASSRGKGSAICVNERQACHLYLVTIILPSDHLKISLSDSRSLPSMRLSFPTMSSHLQRHRAIYRLDSRASSINLDKEVEDEVRSHDSFKEFISPFLPGFSGALLSFRSLHQFLSYTVAILLGATSLRAACSNG